VVWLEVVELLDAVVLDEDELPEEVLPEVEEL
jgi:hypothetical protein